MKRHAAFLRGVSPMNLKMADLKRALERGGFGEVRTILSSGNAVFSVDRVSSAAKLSEKVEQAIDKELGRTFMTIVRSVDELQALIERDPFSSFRLPREAKRVVTFLREKPKVRPRLPIDLDGARILAFEDDLVFSAYVPGPRGPVFMQLIEKTFGKDVTTRTWDTVRKVAR